MVDDATSARPKSAPQLASEYRCQTELFRAASRQLTGTRTQQRLSGAVREAQVTLRIESEDCDIHVRHELVEERTRFQRAQPLLVQRVAERVRFHHDLAHGIFRIGVLAAQGVVAFT
jgi:hypothetical protein